MVVVVVLVVVGEVVGYTFTSGLDGLLMTAIIPATSNDGTIVAE